MLNFNVDPYYDDFDPNNNYHRILFKPGRAVQARELTQSQTILQDQISKFADHIFKQNTPVKGGQVTVNLNAKYLKLNASYNDSDIVASDFLNQIVTDDTGTILAKVIATEEASTIDPPTLVLTYFSGSEFQAGANVISTTTTAVAQAVPTDASGLSSVASVAEGVFYIVNGYSYSSVQNPDSTYSRYSIGNFVSLQPQTIILSKYNNVPTKRVGISISEFISDYVTDPALLDPAVGATNYQAPGADRYTIKLTLDTKSIDFGSDSNFIELVRVTDGKIQRLVDGTVYGVIDDYMAKRTYDTNGDFIVNDFKLTPSANVANGDKFNLQVGTGTAYVQGYRVEATLDTNIVVDRARTTETVNNNPVNIDYGSYFYVNNANNVLDVSQFVAVDFHVVNTNSAIVTTNTTTYSSTKAGTGYIRGFSYDSNTTDANTKTYVYKAYVNDIQNSVLSSNVAAASAAANIVFYDTTGKFSSTANAYYGVTVSIDSGTSSGDTRKIVSYNGTTKTATVDSAFTQTLDTTSRFSLRFDTKDFDMLVHPTASGYAFDAWAGMDNKGKEGNLSIGATKLQDGATPELLFNVGYPYVGNISDTSYSTYKVFRGVSFSSATGGVAGLLSTPSGVTFIGTGGVAQSADVVKQNYTVIVTAKGTSSFEVGDIINFTGTNTVTLDSGKGNATLFVNGGSSFTATVITKVFVSNANSTSLTLKAKNLITANTTGVNYTGTSVGGLAVDLTNAQVYVPYAAVTAPGVKQKLYISDVKRIVKIIDTGSSATAPTNAMLTNSSYDVTQNYKFDNGQRDGFYDHAGITLVNGAPKAKGNLLVFVDYYQHTGGDGYFSVNSYLNAGSGGISLLPEAYATIPKYTSKSGTIYSLRDCIDFRPAVLNAQAAFTFRYATTPTVSNSAGIYLPIDASQFLNDYTHYLGRKDVLVLSKDKSFKLVTGTPANKPAYPQTPDGSLAIANLALDPYTAYLPSEASNISMPNLSIEKIQHKRWAMADISNLQTRINNIEYYTSLTQLEKDAEALQVPDTFGLNRFKNGILVDNFTGYTTADGSSADYAAKINRRQQRMGASDYVMNFPLLSKDVMNSYGRLSDTAQAGLSYKVHSISGQATNIFTLPYATANLVTQKIASNTVSLNPFAVAQNQGILEMNPPMDSWVSTTKEPDILLVDPSLSIFKEGKTVNQLAAADWQTVAGTSYNTTSQSGRAVTVSTYASQSQQAFNGAYDKVNSFSGNFITDVSVQPYIRAQQVVVKAKGMKVNTPVSAFFDGVNVNNYLTLPNIVELTGVSGTFQEGDVVGYYSAGTFTPTATVVSTTNMGSNRIRLYLTGDSSTTSYTTNGVLQNAVFNSNGVYSSSSASGTLASSTTQTISVSGKIAGYSGGSVEALNEGGSFVTGTTSITLDSKASATNNFYNGSTIVLTSLYRERKVVQTPKYGWYNTNGGSTSTGNLWSYGPYTDDVVTYVNSTRTSTAVITAYNGTTKVATLATAVGISTGTNAKAGVINSTYSIQGTSYLPGKAISSQGMPMMATDETGKFTAIFNIPSSVFKTGDRILRIDNRTSDTDPDSATTSAQGVFTASNLSTKSQSLNFGSTVSAAGKSTVFETQNKKDNVLISNYTFYLDPIAQTFIVDNLTYPNGVFLSSIKVFFKTKPADTTSVPVQLFITDTTNGYPNGQALDHSLVMMDQKNINVSSTPHYLDAGTYTEFKFEAPVYIRPNNLYAFILKTTSPDYTVWVGAQNATAISSTVKVLPTDPTPTSITKIGGSPYVGALFESQNGITWTADQTKNMMFTLDRCVFDTAAAPTLQFVVPKRLPTRKYLTNAFDYTSNANTAPDLTGIFFSNDLRCDAFNLSTTDFIPTGTNINYTYTPTLQSSYAADDTKDISPGKFGTTLGEHIHLDDGKGPRVLDANSTASFSMYAAMTSSSDATSPVLADDGMSLYAIKYNVNNMGISNTDIVVANTGAGYNVATATVTISAPTGFGGAQAYASANVVGGVIDKIIVTTEGSGYIETPTVTITGANTIPAIATVNGETSKIGGNGVVRYTTKKVVLGQGNDSADLRVFFTAYKPLGSSINVYYKVLSKNDTSLFEDQNWVLMTQLGQSTAYSPNRETVIEYEMAPGTGGVASNQITYTSSNGTTYNNFNQYAIKIVIATADTTKVPFLDDLRVLALPSGTGL